MKQAVERTGRGESGWAIRQMSEQINDRQIAARDLLVEKVGLSHAGATSYVKAIGPDASVALKILLEQSKDPVKDYTNFVNGRAAAHH